MTKTKKRLAAALLSFACVFACFFLFAGETAKAEGETAAEPNVYEYDFAKNSPSEAAEFAMANGAAVRLSENETGIRFIAGIRKDAFQTLLGYDDLEIGILISPRDLTDGAPDLADVENGNAVAISYAGEEIETYTFSGKDTETGTAYVIFAGSLTDVYVNNYDRDFAASAYYSYTGAEGETVVYAASEEGESVRSLQTVARAVQTAGYPDTDDVQKAVIDAYADKYQVAAPSLWTESEGSALSPQFVVPENGALFFDALSETSVTVTFAGGEPLSQSFAAGGGKIPLNAYAGEVASVSAAAGSLENVRIEEYFLPKLAATDFSSDDFSAETVGGTGTLSVAEDDTYGQVLQLANGEWQADTQTRLTLGDNFLDQISEGDEVSFAFRIIPGSCNATSYNFRSLWANENKHFDDCFKNDQATNTWVTITLGAEEAQELKNNGIRLFTEPIGATAYMYILQFADFKVIKHLSVMPTQTVAAADIAALFAAEGIEGLSVTPVSLDGEPFTFPENYTFAEGEHALEVKVSADGYAESTITVQVTSAREKVVLFGFEDGVIPEYSCPLGGVNILREDPTVQDYDQRKVLHVWSGVDGAFTVVEYKFTAEQLAQIEEGDQFIVTFYIDKFETGNDTFTYQSLYNGESNNYPSANNISVSAGEWRTVTLSAEDTALLKTTGSYGIRLLKTDGSVGNCCYKMYIDEFAILKAL